MNSALRIEICTARTVGMRFLGLIWSPMVFHGVGVLCSSGAAPGATYTPGAMASASLPLKCWTGMGILVRVFKKSGYR